MGNVQAIARDIHEIGYRVGRLPKRLTHKTVHALNAGDGFQVVDQHQQDGYALEDRRLLFCHVT